MRKHIVSFIRGPIGYTANFIASVLVLGERLPIIGRGFILFSDYCMAPLCEAVCLRDGVQDSPLFNIGC